MDKLPESLALDILSRLNDSADVARCRLAWKTFDTLFPELRSINLQCSLNRYIKSRSRLSNSSNSSHSITPFKTIFLNLVSNMRIIESVCIGTEKPLRDVSYDDVEDESDDLFLTDGDFLQNWLPSVCDCLKSLSISDFWIQSCWRRSDLLPLISGYCHNLLELEVKNAWLSVERMNPMPNLTTLTLEFIRLDDEDLNTLNKSFPNLQVLNLRGVGGLKLPKIHLINLKSCHWTVSNTPSYLTLITPNLTTLKLQCIKPTSLYIQSPILSHLHLTLDNPDSLTVTKFQNLKTLSLESLHIGPLLSKFPSTKTVESLTIDSREWEKETETIGSSKFTLEKVFKVFPNVNSLCVNSSAWTELEACYDPESWEILNGRKGLKSFCAYLLLVDPLLTFSTVASILDNCVGLVDVKLIIHRDVVRNVSKSFILKCEGWWPGVKWKWGMWREGMEVSWIIDADSV